MHRAANPPVDIWDCFPHAQAMVLLGDIVSPGRIVTDILPLENTADAGRFELLIKRALLYGCTDNSDLRWEYGQIWAMCFLASPRSDTDVDLDNIPAKFTDGMLATFARRLYGGDRRPVIFGTILVELAAREIELKFTFSVLPAVSEEANARLVHILSFCAQNCPFEKHGDEHMHVMIRLLLPNYEDAALGKTKPYEAMDRSYDKASSIRLIRPMFEKMPAEHVQSVSWKKSDASELALVCGILAEHIDDCYPKVFGNGSVLTQNLQKTPSIFSFKQFGSFSDAVGVAFKNCFYRAPKVYPLASIVAFWAKHTSAANDLYSAIQDPSSLSPTSQFKRILLGE